MRTAQQCLAKAAALDHRAARCPAPKVRADLSDMADSWRWLAMQAFWQDEYSRTDVIALAPILPSEGCDARSEARSPPRAVPDA